MPRPIDHRPRQHRPVLTHDQRSPRRRCSLHDRPARGGGYPRALRFQNDNFVGCTAGIRGLRRARGGGLEAQPPQHRSIGQGEPPQVARLGCDPLPSHQAPATGIPSRVAGAAVAAVVAALACQLAHSCPPSSSLASLALSCDPLQILTCALQLEAFAFRFGPSRLTCASSAAAIDTIDRSQRHRAQPADRRDVGASLPQQRAWWRCVRVAGACPTRVCVPASSEPASRVRPSSPVSWELVCAAFARPDAQSSRLRAC